MTDFLQGELRPLTLSNDSPFTPKGLALGKGPHALEVAVAEADRRPTTISLRRTWDSRLGGRAVPLILVVLYDEKAALCGPPQASPTILRDLDPEQVEKLCETALSKPDRHAALRFLEEILQQDHQPVLGLCNQGLLATHELVYGVPQRPDWQKATQQARSVLGKRGSGLLHALGFEIQSLPGPVSVLRTHGTRAAIALFLNSAEAITVANERFSGLSPIAYAMARADGERLPYVIATVDDELRLYSTDPDLNIGQGGRTEAYLRAHLNLLTTDQAGYLWLLFSADALRDDGTFSEILAHSQDYAADLGSRLRERIYREVIPELAEALARARALDSPTVGELESTFEMALLLLFRLLFVAYAEDQGLLPYRTNALYTRRSLKQKAHELQSLHEQGLEFGPGDAQWEEVSSLFAAVDKGKPEWGIPEYDGGLFSENSNISPIGAELTSIRLSDVEFGPVLKALLLDESPEGLGPVDFRSLGVREFGTIYEGILESELSVAETDLTIDEDDFYVPVTDGAQAVVQAGEVYLHNASGRRKSTGSYYTKAFAVEHLLDHSLEPALDAHLQRLNAMDDSQAGKSFFNFRVADIAMGSGHFLVAAVDHVERRLSNYLAGRPLPAVIDELERLRSRAQEEVKELGTTLDIDDTQLLRRQIARRCIYGVDLNPVAVQLARLSLWIHTFVPGLPLSLLDYNLVVGNSLVGIATWQEALELIGAEPKNPQRNLFASSAEEILGAAQEELTRLGRLADADAAEIRRAREVYHEAREALRPAEALFDVLAASRLDEGIRTEIEQGAATKWVEDPTTLLGSAVHERAKEMLQAIPPFHFPTAFPQVFLRDRPGFDVIVGNPPWEEATLEEERFWTRYVPGLQGLPQHERERIRTQMRKERPDLIAKYQAELATTELLRAVLTTGPYPGMGTGDPDLYKAFVWRFWHLATEDGGRVGVVLPRSAFAAKGASEFRKAILKGGRVENLTMLLNSGNWVFDMEPRYTVALFSLDRHVPGKDQTLPLHGPYRSLESYKVGMQQPPVQFPVADVLGWTDTAALPLLPTEDSAAVFAQLRKAPRLDLYEEGAWRARPYAELHATNDKPLMYFSATPPRGYWPIYKGASFDIWEPDTGTYYAYADPEAIIRHLQDKRERASRNSRSPYSEFDQKWIRDPKTLPCLHARVAFRDVTRATDTRTVRVALVPPKVVITNKGPFFVWPQGDSRDEAFLLGVLSSIPLDWYARRFVETTLNYHILNPFPIPRPSRDCPLWQRTVALAGRLACPDERFTEWAGAVGVEFGPLDPDTKEDMIRELDAVIAHLYGLTEPQLHHIFDTFHEGWDYEDQWNVALRHYRLWEARL